MARNIIGEGQGPGGAPSGLGWVIPLATAPQESGLQDLGQGSGTALGLFQQQPGSGWGIPAQILDPAVAAEAFYGAEPIAIGMTTNTGLMEVPSW